MTARSALAIVIVWALAPAAYADKVDWTPYLEKPGTVHAYKSTKPAADSPPREAKAKAKKGKKAKGSSKARRKGR